ncbi:MAG: glycerophosphoryl diester phosphodiesterase [Deltaproteobacteria bacterium]|nr:glycerophosphoryl diester phosphodiesterase [Deltaproteobacteria bacterium]
MLAFDKAVAVGADGLELDVRFDGDQRVVVFHDDALERLTGQPGLMSQLSTAGREALRVGGERVPLLTDVLDTFDIELDIEIKADRPGRMGELVEAVSTIVKQSRRIDQILVSSFDPFSLLQFHRHLPDVAIAHIFHGNQHLPLRRGWVGKWIGASLMHPEHSLCTEDSMRRWHTAGMPVNAWTVDDPAELRRLARLGVDGVFSNDPGQALRVLSEP